MPELESSVMPSSLQVAPSMQRPPESERMGPGIAFAIVAHALLLLALTLNVQWHSQTPEAADAELWAAVPQVAAPRAQEPEPQPEPTPPAKVEPPQPTPEQVQAEQQAQQAQRDADIAIAKAKAKQEQEQAERQAELLKQRQLEEQKAQQAKALKEQQQQQAKLDQAKLEQQRKNQDAKKDKAAEAKLEAMRRDYLKRIQGMAGATGSADATGNALHSAGPSAGYAGRIKARIRPNITYNDQSAGNPKAVVEVRVAPDGSIISRRLVSSSGVAEWDNAVLRAIDKTAMLPRDMDGSVPPVMVITFQPRE